MIHFRRVILTLVALAMMTVLAACQSAEERAEEHYQRALELLAEGDFPRAEVEFRNVFQLNGVHLEARATYAAALRERGDIQASYSQYLRLAEQDPDNVETRFALTEMAIGFGSFEEAGRHGRRAMEQAPDDPRSLVVELSLGYIDAMFADDGPARREITDRAVAARADLPDSILLQSIIIDNALREGDQDTALEMIDTSLALTPDDRQLHDLRLRILADQDRQDELETQLVEMLERFPEDDELPGTLLRYYLSTGQTETAIAFLRDEAAAADNADDRQEVQIALVQLSRELDGDEAALAELDAAIAATPEGDSTARLRALRASLRFDPDAPDEAISELEALLDEDGLIVTDEIQFRVTLARMLMGSGNMVGARAQVERILELDPVETEALKMRAAWLIEEDEADRAIGLLRTALDNAPDDPQALSLMARAHTRNGSHELAREFLSLAAEASNYAPPETLRYAEVLIEAEQYLTAENLLIDALRLAPGQIDLMAALGELYMRMQDWPRAEQVETTLAASGDADSQRIAEGLRVARLAAQGRTDEAMAEIEALADTGGTADIRAQIAVLRARLGSGDIDGAMSFADQLVEDAPEIAAYRFARAAVQQAAGDLEAAEASYRALIADEPALQQAWIGLIRVLNGQGRGEEAEAVLAEALETLPDALDLLWARASVLEREGDIEGAIGIYEIMYERAPNAPVVANNLASLLSTYRADDESLDRAWTVARRLRGSELPAFQDTYGWIAYRRGDLDEALDHLEPAAEGLPGDPLVQFHLGMTYSAAERYDEALAQLRRALDIAGPDDTRAQFATARDEIARIEALIAAAEGGEVIQSSETAPDTTITVSDEAAFEAAYAELSEGQGGVIALAPGTRGLEIVLRSGGDAPVTITSADPANPAELSLIFLERVRNITVSDVTVDSRRVSGRDDWIQDVMLRRAENIVLERISFRNSARGLALSESQLAGSLGMIRNTRGVIFEDNTVEGYFHGFTILESDDVAIRASSFTHMQGDGIRMAGVRDIEISGNLFAHWLGTSQELNHSDMIQLWTTNADRATHGLTIANNVFDTSNGVATQTIFLGNESMRESSTVAPMMHRDITITGNLIYGGHHHAILVSGTRGALISRNTVLWNEAATIREHGEDRNMVPHIRVVRVTNGTVSDNIAPGFDIESAARVSGNWELDYEDPSDPGYITRHFTNATGGNVALGRITPVATSPLADAGAMLIRQ